MEGTSRAAPPANVTLPDSGLTILRNGHTRAIFDHGPHGHTSLAAHAHADALRLDLALGAEELIVDPGVGSYFARPALRAAFRGTSFHATVCVDDLDSSESGGPFLWTQHARARLLVSDLENGFVVAEHDGYERLTDPVTHRRAVIALSDGSVLVVDLLMARETHRYSQRWPLHPDLELEHSGEVAVATKSGAGVLLSFGSPAPLEITASRGDTEPLAGWWSERLESAIPGWLVAVSTEVEGPVELATLLVPFETVDGAPDSRLSVTTEQDGLQLEVTGARHRELIVVDLRSTPVRVTREAHGPAGSR